MPSSIHFGIVDRWQEYAWRVVHIDVGFGMHLGGRDAFGDAWDPIPTIGLLSTLQSVRETTMEEIVAFPLDIANDAALSDIWNSHHSEVAANGNKLALLHGEKSGDDSVHVGLRFS